MAGWLKYWLSSAADTLPHAPDRFSTAGVHIGCAQYVPNLTLLVAGQPQPYDGAYLALHSARQITSLRSSSIELPPPTAAATALASRRRRITSSV